MVDVIDVFIDGVPCTSNNKSTRDAWKARIAERTRGLTRVSVACRLTVEFRLGSESYATASEYGSDLDNLLRPFLNALETTVLTSGDECVVELMASKSAAGSDAEAGAALRIEPIG